VSDRDGVYRVDRMRIWNHVPGSHIAYAEMRAPEGKMFVVQVVAIEAHPMPKANRRKVRRPFRADDRSTEIADA
jgi:hypothetical protein